MNKTILIATPLYPPQIGGPAKYAYELQQEFERQGYSVRVVCYSALERGLPVGIRHFVYFVRILVNVRGVEGVLAFDTWSVGLPAVIAARLVGARIVMRIGGDFLWESWVARTRAPVRLSEFYKMSRALSLKERIIRAGTRYILARSTPAFNTIWQRDIWQAAYGFPPASAHVVENFYPEPAVPSPSKGTIFVAAGRDIALKNQHGLHEAFTKVKERHPDIALDERMLPPRENEERLRTCYAVVIASISEVNSNTAIEAAAARKPFIAPLDCGGKERLAGMGLFVDTTDTAALQGALERLLDPAVYASCVAASANLRPHPWSDIAHEYAALLK